MQKSASAYKTISEVSEMLDIPAHVLRFWESKFSQLKPMKRSGGRRYYRQEDIALLETIKSLLYDEGYTIKGAQASLSKRRKADAVPASPEAAGQGPAALAPSVPVSLPSLQQAASLLAQAQSRIDTLLARI
ncbi:MAG: MerR family transcriptional regulator [Candidatus Puniceispirillaceae bacterium]